MYPGIVRFFLWAPRFHVKGSFKENIGPCGLCWQYSGRLVLALTFVTGI